MPTVQLKGHTNDGITFSFSHAGDLLASNGWGQPLRLWDPRTAELLLQIPVDMRAIRFSSDDRRVAAANAGNGRLQILEIAPVRKYFRTLVRDQVLGRGSYHLPAVSPDGRLLAVGMQDGVGLWDFITGNPLTFLPSGINYAVLFEPTGALLASGPTGVVRWPIEVDTPVPGMVRFGDAQRLPLPGPSNRIGMSKDGQIIAKAMGRPGVAPA
jgi:WD40 repeat protein